MPGITKNLDAKGLAFLKKTLESDETLLWAGKSKGVIFNRVGIGAILLVALLNYFMLKAANTSSLYAIFVLGLMYIFAVLTLFAPLFTYHIVTNRRLFSTTNIPLIDVGTTISRASGFQIRPAKWAGKNSYVVTQTSFRRSKLIFGRFRLYFSYGKHASVFHGVCDPESFSAAIESWDDLDS